MGDLISISCEPRRHEPDAGNEEPGCGAGDTGFEILCEPAVSPEPGQGPFNDPAFGQ